MSAAQPTHYEVLGLPSTATQDEIKKRYRELARRHHPDVAKSPEAARFREINEAHRVLSDPSRRANYDAELRLKARLQNPGGPSPAGSRPTTGAERPTPGSERPAAQRPHDPTTQRPGARPGPDAARRPEINTLLEEARRALSRMRYREADDLCRHVLRLDRRNSAAYELLGDAHQKRARMDEAIAMYSYAIQLDRANHSAQQKLDHVTGQKSGATMAGSAARASRRGPASGGHRERPTRTVTAIGFGLILFMVSVVWTNREPMAHGAWIMDWDPLLVLALAVSGLAAGLTLAWNGWLDLSAQALGAERAAGVERSPVPLGLVIGGFAVVLFHASAALYLAIGLLLGRTARSVIAAYVITYLLVLLFAAAGETAGGYILLFGGNIVFPLLLAGWSLGDRLR